MKLKKGFTLIELLFVIAIIGILAALLFPVLAAAKNQAKRTVCLNNLRNINLALHTYTDEHDDTLPFGQLTNYLVNYESLIRNYLGGATTNSAVFACPADSFFYKDARAYSIVPQSAHSQAFYNYSSYAFNAGNIYVVTNRWPGIAGWKTTTVKEPAKTILIYDLPAQSPYSWHQPRRLPGALALGVNNSKNTIAFADGHVDYVRIFYDEINIATGHDQAWQYDPPGNYDYKWSGD